jgi:hypothetical protein
MLMLHDRYNYAYCLTLYVVAMGMKWADLVKRSTMTNIELYPHKVWGKPTMKSIQMFSHFHSRMLKGCRFFVGLK